jgi:hypothetical protein
MCETENDNNPQVGKKPTTEDEFYLEWGKESLKNNINLANEILKQLITLSTALLGVSIIFDKIVSDEILRIVVLSLFFISLVLSLLGILPYEKNVALNSPTEIKKFKRKALTQKRIYIWISGAGLTFGFAIILAELIFKLLNK